jgi:rhodanese-related sulfurtransferase
MKKSIYIAFMWCLLLNLESCQSHNTTIKLKAVDFEKAISGNDVQLLDVRTLEEYNAGHIRNSILGDINNNSSYQKAVSVLDKNKPVYVYCLAGGRSHTAAEDLSQMGFKHVTELEGGMNAWRKAALTEEKNATTKEMIVTDFRALMAKNGSVLICIQSKYCGPCVKMKPVIEAIEKENALAKIIKVDGGVDREVMKELKVSEIPTFIVYKNGKETFRYTGIIEKATLEKELK